MSDGFSNFFCISSTIDFYYNSITISDKVSQKKSNIQKIIKTILSKDLNKLDKLNVEKISSADRDKYKVWADLISANSVNIEKGQEIIVVENFYDPNLKTVEIILDKTKSPWENAQLYYKKYSKLKTSSKLLQEQIPKLENEISYLYQVLDTLNYIETNVEIEEIRLELEEYGYLKKKKIQKQKNKSSTALHFVNKNGADIYVGKNNFQNDFLTLKFANKNDFFIHAKDIPGSHVILRNNNVNDEDILDACSLAAHYSSHTNEDFVQVDYTYKKNVRKPKNAKPGMVYYDNYETIIVDLKNFDLNLFRKIK